jgi:transposase-like protein
MGTILLIFAILIVGLILFQEFYHPDCPRCSSHDTEAYVKNGFECDTIWHCRYCNKTFKIYDKS